MMTGTTTKQTVASRVTLKGPVQGIGMRPAITRVAKGLKLHGFVRNTTDGVEIHVQGSSESVTKFIDNTTDMLNTLIERRGSSDLPRSDSYRPTPRLPRASERIGIECLSTDVMNIDTFTIEMGDGSSRPSILSTRVPVDVVACERCLNDIAGPTDRRHGYPFTSCTDCGPRFSIIHRMPYERQQTSMVEFSLCDHCRQEYESPTDRRFHSQANACCTCGPKLWACGANDQAIARGQDAIDRASAAIENGQIVAIRGLGGYQLLADATSQKAIDRLRHRKERKAKPLAVMVDGLNNAGSIAALDDRECELLACSAGRSSSRKRLMKRVWLSL